MQPLVVLLCSFIAMQKNANAIHSFDGDGVASCFDFCAMQHNSEMKIMFVNSFTLLLS